MTTRSAYKCTISSIGLDPEDSITVEGALVHKTLHEAWLETIQEPISINDARARLFISNQFNVKLVEILSGTLEVTSEIVKAIKYLKVLTAWQIIIDSRGAIETLTSAINVAGSVVTTEESLQAVEYAFNFFNAALVAIFKQTDVASIVNDIDAHKIQRKQRSDITIWNYAVSDHDFEGLLAAYVLNGRLH